MEPLKGAPLGTFRNQQEADVSQEVQDCMDKKITATMCAMNISMILGVSFPKLQYESDYLKLVQRIAEESCDEETQLIDLEIIREILRNPNSQNQDDA